MAAAKHNLIVSRGEDVSFKVTVSDGSSPIVVTGNTFKSEIRRASGKPLVASFTCAVTDGSAGEVTVTLPRSESLKLDANTTYKWDIFRIESGTPEITTRLIYGDVIVEGNVTDISNFVT